MTHELTTSLLPEIEAAALSQEAQQARLEAAQNGIAILDHHWSRQHPDIAAQGVAKVLAALYVRHAIHDNLDAFAQQIANRQAFVWLITKDQQVVGSSCLLDNGNGGLEIARSGIIPNSGAQGVGKIPMLERVAAWLTETEFQLFDHLEGTVRMAATWQGIPGGMESQAISLRKCDFRLFAIEHLFHHGDPLRQEPFGHIIKFRDEAEFLRQNQNTSLTLVPALSQIPLPMNIKFSSEKISSQPVLLSCQNIGDHAAILTPDPQGQNFDQAIAAAQKAAWFTEIIIPADFPDSLSLQTQAATAGFSICGFLPNWNNTMRLSLKLGRLRPTINVAPTESIL